MKYDCDRYQICWDRERCDEMGICLIGHEARRLAEGGSTFTKDGSLGPLGKAAAARIAAGVPDPNQTQL